MHLGSRGTLNPMWGKLIAAGNLDIVSLFVGCLRPFKTKDVTEALLCVSISREKYVLAEDDYL